MLNINCDLGEGLNNENIIMPLIDSCNIACGGHAGDNVSMIECVEISIRNNVKIGAHPSYPDKINFGRKKINISPLELSYSIICLLYTSPSPRDRTRSRMPSSA